jgi:chromate transporter
MALPEENARADRTSLGELAALFTRLGFTAFGGPAAHIAYMENEVVARRRWLDRQQFLDVIASINFIPGPNSTELAIHIGQLRAGFPGLLVAGVCFITPAMLIILPLAWMYVKWGSLPQAQPALQGIAAAVAGLVIFATARFAQTAIKDPFSFFLACVAALIAVIGARFPQFQPELCALIFSAITGVLFRQRSSRLLAIALPITFWKDLLRMTLSFLKIGATLFGSGYVLVSYLQSTMVDRWGWLTQQQLVDAIAVGQFTPGPLLTTATFIGYLLGHSKFAGGVPGGIIGGIVATIAIFSPAFILIALFGPLLEKLRQNPRARGALDGMNAAVVGLMAVVAVRLAFPVIYIRSAHHVSLLGIIIIVATLFGLWRKINATWLILAAGAIGALAHIIIS